jgi:hypothetical protein
MRRYFYLLFFASMVWGLGCKPRAASGPTDNASVNAALRTIVYQLYCSGDTATMKRDISTVMGCSGEPTITMVFADNFIALPNWQRREQWKRSHAIYSAVRTWYALTSADTAGLLEHLWDIQPLPVAIDSGASMCLCNGLIRVAFKHTSFKKPGLEEQTKRWPGPTLFITLSQPIPLNEPGVVAYYFELAGKEDERANSGHYFIIDTKRRPQRVLASDMIFIH